MSISPTFSTRDIEEYVAKRAERVHEAVLYYLNYAGVKAVNEVRLKGNYTDRSRNLRGSTGYLIVYNGPVVSGGGFEPIDGGGVDGTRIGRDYALQLANHEGQGYVLIVVAGMHYASYVAARGYDVLQSGKLLAEHLVPRLMEKLKAKLQ